MNKKPHTDKATKMRAIADLQNNGFNVKKIAEKYGVSRESIYTWRNLYGSDVVSKTVRPDIAQKAVDAAALQKVEEINLETIKKQIATRGAEVLLQRLNENAKYIENKDLISIIKLVESNQGQTPKYNDVLDEALRNFALSRASESYNKTPN
jgi:transposase-like protein